MTSGAPQGDLEKRNNIDLLRFLLAAIVVLYHVQMLAQVGALRKALGWADGQQAVMAFFALSGYAVSLSYRRSGSFRKYAMKRVRRLLPGYAAVVLLCWIAGCAISTLGFAEYWRSGETWRNLAANLTFLQFLGPNLPGVFAGNPLISAVNGSLWSIRTELFCYALVPLLAVARWRPAALVAVSLAGVALLFRMPEFSLLPSLPLMLRTGVAYPLAAFALGAWLQAAGRRAAVWGWCGALFLIPHGSIPGVWFLEPLAMAALVLPLALTLPYLGDWTSLGNLSYGIYLWHFPIVQTLCTIAWLRDSPWLFLVATLVLTLAFATASWNFVEKGFLRRAA